MKPRFAGEARPIRVPVFRLGLMAAALTVSISLFAATALADHRSRETGCAGNPAVAAIPFQFIGGHLFTQAMLNGKGPFLFVVDTGGVNLVTPALETALSLTNTGEERGHGVGPKTVESGEANVARIKLGPAAFENQKFYVYPLEKLYAIGGVRMQGMVGNEIFRHYVTQIDYRAHMIRLINRSGFDARLCGTPIPLTAADSEMHIPASFDGIPGTFVIHSGSGAALDLSTPFAVVHQLRSQFPNGLATVSSGVGGASRSYTVRGRNLQIGRFVIAHPIVSFSTAQTGALSRKDIAGEIGNGVWKRFLLTFDFAGKALYLEPRDQSEPLDAYDRSGMSLVVDPADFRIVAVANGTPAEQAGLKVGDVVVAINGKPAKSIALPDLRQRLRNNPVGTLVAIEVIRDGRKKTAGLVLRNLL
ncbi:MAG: PDZ domain-containing protein [Rhizomicrobium sp.]